MRTDEIEAIADRLYRAAEDRRTIAPLTETEPSITLANAYAVQKCLEAKYVLAGDVIVGRKIGVTSEAVQDMLGVRQPDFGFLTNRMVYSSGADIGLHEAKLIQPRAEGEIAFRMARDLRGPGVTADSVLEATESVCAAFEIVDSRIHDWRIRIEDTVADNASCGVLVLGSRWMSPKGIDLAAVRMDVLHNGQPVGTGYGSAVQGHPAAAVAWLANTLGELGVPLRRGDIVLSGALSKLVPVSADDRFDLEMSALGIVSVQFHA